MYGILHYSMMERKEWQRGIVGRGKAEEAKLFDHGELGNGINMFTYVGYPTYPFRKPHQIPKRGTLSLRDSAACYFRQKSR
jgi:hypothetical protein